MRAGIQNALLILIFLDSGSHSALLHSSGKTLSANYDTVSLGQVRDDWICLKEFERESRGQNSEYRIPWIICIECFLL